ncbi:MAG: site-specific DNA-methyltransferase, partial [Gammaproteobacteria bacterium]|nr:site-specific DNA-methyltransferase [Gammaproteobacteria bacterium]
TETVLWAAKTDKSKHVFNYQLMRQHNGGKQMKTVWKIGTPKKSEKQFGKHPTQKPLELIDRILLASSNEGDLVFDPFMGSCSTGLSALQNNRKFVGCEMNKEYVDLSVARLSQERMPFEPMIKTA